MAVMVIMIAIIIMLILFLMIAVGYNQRNRSLQRPAQIDYDALADAELQSYLPDNKIGAIKRYHELTGVGLKEAKDVIEWALANPTVEGKLKGIQNLRTTPISGEIDLVALRDPALQSNLPRNKIEAIKRYRELTGVGLKEAKDAVEWLERNPDALDAAKDVARAVDTQGAGIRDLVAEGRIEEAIKVYAAFMGVDPFSARDAIEQIQREIRLDDQHSSTLGELLSDEDTGNTLRQNR